MTLNLSEAKNHGCRPHLRGSVRRASGFVLTGNPNLILRWQELGNPLIEREPQSSIE